MRDAMGRVQSVLVLGGTSEIGLAVTRALVEGTCRRVTLAGRDPLAAERAGQDLALRGVAVDAVAFDATDTAGHGQVIDDIFGAHDDIDLVLVAFGVLGDQAACEADPQVAVEVLNVNYVGAVSACLHVARRLRQQGHGTIVILSSVAAERPRRDTYVYGSSKAGLDAFGQGLGDALIGSGARVMVVRPGFVHTKMTQGLAPAPFSTTPDQVARAVVRGLERNDEIVWAPGLLRWLFVVMRHLPRGVWRKVSAR